MRPVDHAPERGAAEAGGPGVAAPRLVPAVAPALAWGGAFRPRPSAAALARAGTKARPRRAGAGA